MARTASGVEHIEAARKLLKSARTADDLRLAQSVLLPLELGLSIEQTAIAIGRSSGATCTMRTRFGKVAAGEMLAPRSKRQLRNRANTSLERERQILDEVLPDAATGGVVIIPRIKPAIEARLGKALALSSVYRVNSDLKLIQFFNNQRNETDTPAPIVSYVFTGVACFA